MPHITQTPPPRYVNILTRFILDIGKIVRCLNPAHAAAASALGRRFRRCDYLTIGLQPEHRPCSAIARSVPTAEKADLDNPGHVAAPLAGVVTVSVAEGDVVRAGQTVATIEAMKMQAANHRTQGRQRRWVVVSQAVQVAGGDSLIVLS
jgi:acetyl/propionyl-CoA carboxylase alpha subunit